MPIYKVRKVARVPINQTSFQANDVVMVPINQGRS